MDNPINRPARPSADQLAVANTELVELIGECPVLLVKRVDDTRSCSKQFIDVINEGHSKYDPSGLPALIDPNDYLFNYEGFAQDEEKPEDNILGKKVDMFIEQLRMIDWKAAQLRGQPFRVYYFRIPMIVMLTFESRVLDVVDAVRERFRKFMLEHESFNLEQACLVFEYTIHDLEDFTVNMLLESVNAHQRGAPAFSPLSSVELHLERHHEGLINHIELGGVRVQPVFGSID